MKTLITIPHYYHPKKNSKHGSTGHDPEARIAALTACLCALYQCFGAKQNGFDISRSIAVPANESLRHDLDIVICTTRERHLLNQLAVPEGSYTRHSTQAKPSLLGFECQAILRERLGAYDYYCYIEDDLLLLDSWFFEKLTWFTKVVGGHSLLQPNRYEQRTQPPVERVYIDGDISPEATASFQNVHEFSRLNRKVLNTPVQFRRALNPHSGCFFLTAEQMAHWAAQDHFLDFDTSFVGPLESAATLGVMKTFRVYKPAPQNASFLEIQHYGTEFMKLINRELLEIARGGPVVEAWESVNGWFNRDKAIAMQRLVRKLPAGSRVVELGSFQGRSGIAIASALPKRSTLFCIDHFKGSAEHQGMKLDNLYETFLSNIQTFGVSDIIETLKMNTKRAARRFAASSVDLIFVDASHDAQSVKVDLEHWYPKLKPGGWLVCDDYHECWPGVIRAIRKSKLEGAFIAPALWAHRKPTLG